MKEWKKKIIYCSYSAVISKEIGAWILEIKQLQVTLVL